MASHTRDESFGHFLDLRTDAWEPLGFNEAKKTSLQKQRVASLKPSHRAENKSYENILDEISDWLRETQQITPQRSTPFTMTDLSDKMRLTIEEDEDQAVTTRTRRRKGWQRRLFVHCVTREWQRSLV